MRRLLLYLLKLIYKLGFVVIRKENFAYSDISKFFTDRKNIVIFDIGANQGDITAELDESYNNAIIHTFEAIPYLAEKQRKRFVDKQNIIVNEAAISNSNEKLEFYVNEFPDTSSLLASDESVLPIRYGNVYKEKEKITVDAITLDDYCKNNNIKEIDFIKMDIQGAELLALEGAEQLLDQGKIKLIYVETMFIPLYKNQAIFSDILSFLSKYNYSLVYMYNLQFNFKTGRLLQCDSVIIHDSVKHLYPKIDL